MHQIIHLLPIIIVSLLVMYQKPIAMFSHSVLGKLIAITLIVFYTKVDVLYGFFVCALVIFYYQTDYVEGFDNSIPKPEDIKTTFKKQNCQNGSLIYKSLPVNPEMTSHIFPEINFKGKQCNPCDENCEYSIIEEKLKNEEDLTTPKNSNDWFNDMWKNITESIPVPAFRLKSESFGPYSSKK